MWCSRRLLVSVLSRSMMASLVRSLVIICGTEMVVSFLMSVRVLLIRWNGIQLVPSLLVLPVPMRILCDRCENGPPGVLVFK